MCAVNLTGVYMLLVYTVHDALAGRLLYCTKYKTARKTHTTQFREYVTLSCTSPATYIIIYT